MPAGRVIFVVVCLKIIIIIKRHTEQGNVAQAQPSPRSQSRSQKAEGKIKEENPPLSWATASGITR